MLGYLSIKSAANQYRRVLIGSSNVSDFLRRTEGGGFVVGAFIRITGARITSIIAERGRVRVFLY